MTLVGALALRWATLALGNPLCLYALGSLFIGFGLIAVFLGMPALFFGPMASCTYNAFPSSPESMCRRVFAVICVYIPTTRRRFLGFMLVRDHNLP